MKYKVFIFLFNSFLLCFYTVTSRQMTGTMGLWVRLINIIIFFNTSESSFTTTVPPYSQDVFTMYNTYEKKKHTNLCWLAFSNKTIYSLSEGTSFCKRNKIVKFHFKKFIKFTVLKQINSTSTLKLKVCWNLWNSYLCKVRDYYIFATILSYW